MKKNNLIIAVLVAVIVLMGVGFAALSTTLKINGTGTISSTWGPIYIDSCSCSVTTSIDSSNKPTASCTPTSGGTSTQVTGTITTNMKLPGDVITCTFNVKNGGSLIAAAPTITADSNTYFTVVGQNGTCIKAKSGTTLGSGSFQVKVTYKSENSAAQSIKVYADYKQATSCS